VPKLKGRWRVDDVETRLQAALFGRGIVQLLSYQAADDLAAGRLVRLCCALMRRRPCRCSCYPKSRDKNRALQDQRLCEFRDGTAGWRCPVLRRENDAVH
jgi:DNA-binding transcriptional LysR family regulator